MFHKTGAQPSLDLLPKFTRHHQSSETASLQTHVHTATPTRAISSRTLTWAGAAARPLAFPEPGLSPPQALSMPWSQRHSGSDGSLWVSLRVPGKDPPRRQREGTRVRYSIPIPWSLCRRGREARARMQVPPRVARLGNPTPGFGHGNERREREPRGAPRAAAPAPSGYPEPKQSRAGRRADGLFTHPLATACASVAAAGAGTATAAPPRPASGHAPAPHRAGPSLARSLAFAPGTRFTPRLFPALCPSG